MLISFPDEATVSAYAVGSCGFTAKEVTFATIKGGSPVTAIVDVDRGYTALVGADAGGPIDALVSRPGEQGVFPMDRSLRSERGYSLQAPTNPSGIVPDLLALWVSASNSRTAILQSIYVPKRDDVWGPGDHPPLSP